jgi:ribosomal protein S18 acetylase RimI-like enzyme
MSLRIRRATADDLPDLAAIYRHADAFHAVALPGVFRTPVAGARTDEYVLECIANPDGVMFLAERSHRPAGLAFVSERHTPGNPLLVPRHYAVVDTISVLPWAQRAGVATALLVACEAWARERGLAEIELSVFEFNTGARALYERLGYATVRRIMTKAVPAGDSATGDAGVGR